MVLSPTLVVGTITGAAHHPFRLPPELVSTHHHVLGLSGFGKSSLLQSLFVQLHNQRIGVALIDPHGDLAQDILRFLLTTGYFTSANAYDRLWYIDFTRPDRFPAFNVLKQPYEDHVVARHLLEAIRRAWSSLEGGVAPQLENTLLAAALVLIQAQHPLTDLPRLISDVDFRDQLVRRVHDPQVVAFFRDRFERSGRGGIASSESLLRRSFLLTYSPALRFALGQHDNLLNLPTLMQRGVSLILNLGGLDEDTQRLLACLLTVGFEQAALARANQPVNQRRPYHLLVDEYSMVAAESGEALSRILDLCRKYQLYLTVANQTGSQLSQRVRGSLQNAVEIVFRLGYDDAHWAAPRYLQVDPTRVKDVPGRANPVPLSAHEQLLELERTLRTLPPRQAIVRVGEETTLLRTLTIPVSHVSPAEIDAVRERYAERLLTPRAAIEQAWAVPDTISDAPADLSPLEPNFPPAYARLFQRQSG